YRIDQTSAVIDPFLRLTTADGVELARNDDGLKLKSLDARILWDCKTTGEYRINASANPELRTTLGGFSLVVAEEPNHIVLKLDNKMALPSGKLTTTLPYEPVRNVPGVTYSIQFAGGKTYRIDLRSKDFDPYLRLEDAWGKELATDDDSGGGLNARI